MFPCCNSCSRCHLWHTLPWTPHCVHCSIEQHLVAFHAELMSSEDLLYVVDPSLLLLEDSLNWRWIYFVSTSDLHTKDVDAWHQHQTYLLWQHHQQCQHRAAFLLHYSANLQPPVTVYVGGSKIQTPNFVKIHDPNTDPNADPNADPNVLFCHRLAQTLLGDIVKLDERPLAARRASRWRRSLSKGLDVDFQSRSKRRSKLRSKRSTFGTDWLKFF